MSSGIFSKFCIALISLKVAAVRHLLAPTPTLSAQFRLEFQSPLFVVVEKNLIQVANSCWEKSESLSGTFKKFLQNKF